MPNFRSGNITHDLINDKSPELGGSLDANDYAVTNVSTLQLSGGSGDQGTISWNADEETIDVVQNGAVLQVGQEIYFHVRNNSGVTIAEGVPVMVTGTIGNSSRLTVAPMDASDISNELRYIGVTTEELANDDDGKVTFFGKVRGIDTSAYSDGTILYLSPTTAGAFTSTLPTFGIKTPVAIVIHGHTNGSLFVRWSLSQGIDDLQDIELTSLSTNDLLVWNTDRWENSQDLTLNTLTVTNALEAGSINGGTY